MNPDNPNEDGLTYDEWMVKVNVYIGQYCGLRTDDLADFPSYDLWNDSVPPVEAAEVCLSEYNDFPEDLFSE